MRFCVFNISQDVIARRKPGVNAATQSDPVVDVAVAQLRGQIAELEQQLRATQSTLATRSSELHQRDASERKLRQFTQVGLKCLLAFFLFSWLCCW